MIDEQRRAPVQASRYELQSDGMESRVRRTGPGAVAGTIAWYEHLEAFKGHAARYGHDQSAQRIAERSGFGWLELVEFLGHEPKTWRPR